MLTSGPDGNGNDRFPLIAVVTTTRQSGVHGKLDRIQPAECSLAYRLLRAGSCRICRSDSAYRRRQGRCGRVFLAAVILAARIRWDLRGRAWFQTLIAAFAIAHIAAVILFGWRIDVHPTILLAPIVVADFAVMVLLIFTLERVASN